MGDYVDYTPGKPEWLQSLSFVHVAWVLLEQVCGPLAALP
jgi:hypothetical protein